MLPGETSQLFFPTSPIAQPNTDTTENLDTQPLQSHTEANDTTNSEQAIIMDSLETADIVEENSKWEELKTCIIQLTELSKAEREKWLMDEESSPQNTPRYDMRDRNLMANHRQSTQNRKNINYSEHNTRENKQDGDYEPVQPPPVLLNNK